MSKSLTVRLTASRSNARSAPISYTPPVNPPPPRTRAVLSARPRRPLPLEPRGLPSGPSSWTTFPMGGGLSQYRLISQSVFGRNLGRSGLFHPQRMGIAMRRGAVTLAFIGAAAIAVPVAADARGIAPDEAAVTPIAHASAKAREAVSASKLSAGLAKLFRRVGRSGAYVMDASDNRVLFARKAGRSR